MLIAIFGCNSKGQQKAQKQGGSPAGNDNLFLNGASEIIQKYEEKTYPNLKAGDVAPDAIKLDVDQIGAIVNGTCIVRKGNSEALIDINGKVIVPWGKYDFNDGSSKDFQFFTTLLGVKDLNSGSQGFINTKGQVVVPMQYFSVSPFGSTKIAQIGTKDRKTIYIDSRGNILPYHSNYLATSADLENYYNTSILPKLFLFRASASPVPYYGKVTQNTPPAVGYATIQQKVVVPVKYLNGHEFSEGRAAVAKADEFGFVKWGFIDETGKEVIPFIFENIPGDFHDGLALVKPASKDKKFDYAYIDRQGNVKIKIGTGDNRPPYYPTLYHQFDLVNDALDYRSGRFTNGYAFWGSASQEIALLDTLGNFHTLSEFSKTKNLETGKKGLLIEKYDRSGIYFWANHLYISGTNSLGVIDFKGNLLYPPAFHLIVPDYYSPYAIAYIASPSSNATTKAGVINHQGVFIMVVEPKAKF